MPKLRIYYDKAGNIVGSEQRIDEQYTDENAAPHEDEPVKWVVLDYESFEKQPLEYFVIKNKKLVKKNK